ncbi:MAG TPA: hypothetical protein VLD38_07290 [Nitrosopumilaceae archaeon]|nr:hypothetical protein [Nitrosopumilaceae archaeon]
MNLEEKVLSQLQDSVTREYRLYYQDKIYHLRDVVITKSLMPVNKPTTRGGVYLVNGMEYKIKGTILDLSLREFISKMMLGPNPEFQEIPIETRLEIDGKDRKIILFCYLTNTMDNRSKITVNLLIIRLKIE